MIDPTRAALSQPEPAGLSVESGMIPMEYADVDSGARIVCEPSEDRPSTGCWVVCNSRHISPLKEFPTAEAAYHALRAAIAADRAQRQPVPPVPGEVEELAQPRSQAEMLAVRPMMEQIAAMGDCIGHQTVGQIMAISQRAAAWLAENPPWQPVAIEPRGCPTPGACSCVMPSTSTAHALPLPGEVEG